MFLKRFILFLLIPMLSMAQIEKSIKYKVAMMQNFVKKGADGEAAFWQTKGKVTFAIVNYTEEQNPLFKNLFIKQYQELLPIYQRMVVSENVKDTNLFIKTLIRQEEDYRALLTSEQLNKYLDKLKYFEENDPQANDSYSSLFFSEKLLNEYKVGFK